ncbi:YtxH domain-containing protein [Pedobacter sp. PLR]|uniref:YtxH domain-containing protein n=1 Tax=Pedobacter sp. PLR TaxID=2994465 RepID=UPI002246ABFF|nr:YtxH domain-containing protein [Pedobacter sp. PLR]MCX2453497.1 YtxH domain-containing protein [Pedobacter sp. PLR]
MKYNNYRNALSSLSAQKTDSTLPVVALLAGLAIGAVIGVLFAPERGADIRTKISDKAKDLSDAAKDKLHLVKSKVLSEADQLAELKDQALEKAKTKSKEALNAAGDIVDQLKSKAKDLESDAKLTVEKTLNS